MLNARFSPGFDGMLGINFTSAFTKIFDCLENRRLEHMCIQ